MLPFEDARRRRTTWPNVSSFAAALIAAAVIHGGAAAAVSHGRLDRAFGRHGQFTLPRKFGRIDDLVADAAGAIVVRTGSVLRGLTPDGRMRRTFGTNGHVTLPALGTDVTPLRVDAQQRILVAGSDDGAIVLLRLTPDGAPDASFGVEGLVTTHVSGTPVDLRPDDAGVTIAGDDPSGAVVVVQRRTDGTPDAAFGVGGTAVVDVGPAPIPISFGPLHARAVTPFDGRSVIVAADEPLLFGTAVLRVDASGERDPAFGDGGSFLNNPESGLEWSVADAAPSRTPGALIVEHLKVPFEFPRQIFSLDRYDAGGHTSGTTIHEDISTSASISSPSLAVDADDGIFAAWLDFSARPDGRPQRPRLFVTRFRQVTEKDTGFGTVVTRLRGHIAWTGRPLTTMQGDHRLLVSVGGCRRARCRSTLLRYVP